MKKLPDIYWIAIEGNRSFESYDKFSKNKIFEKLSNTAILFSNTIATATSTLMSTSSFFTGRFSYELYYAHEAMKKFEYDSYPKELERKGYELNSIFFCREGKEFYEKYLNVHLTRDDYKSLNNKILTKFKEVMISKISKNKPKFFYIHLAPTKESEEPEYILNFLKEKNLFKSSFIVISSDHGYCDYGKIHSLGWLLKPKNHSQYVSEDCYRSNLLMKIPKKYSEISSKQINSQVSLIDVFETIFDYLNIEYKPKNKKAISLKKAIETNNYRFKNKLNERLLRIDNRYIGQNFQKTIIRNNNYELIIENNTSKLFKRNEHKNWKKRLKKINKNKNKVVLRNLNNFLKLTEKETKKTNIDVLKRNYYESELKKELRKIKNKKIGVFNYSNKYVLKFIVKKLKKNNQVIIVDTKSLKKITNKLDYIFILINNPYSFGFHKFIKFCKKKKLKTVISNIKFEKQKFQPHSIIKHARSDWRAYVDHKIGSKFVIFLMLCWLQLLDMYYLWKAKKRNLLISS